MRYALDEHGQVIGITDAKDGLVRLCWSATGQLTSYTDCSGRVTRYEYDRRDRLATITDADQNTTCFDSDALGRITAAHYPDDSHNTYRYDQTGALVCLTDGLGRPTRFSLDTYGRLVQRTDQNGHTLRQHWDAAGNLLELQNENGQRYRFDYDAADRLVAEYNLDGPSVVTYSTPTICQLKFAQQQARLTKSSRAWNETSRAPDHQDDRRDDHAVYLGCRDRVTHIARWLRDAAGLQGAPVDRIAWTLRRQWPHAQRDEYVNRPAQTTGSAPMVASTCKPFNTATMRWVTAPRQPWPMAGF